MDLVFADQVAHRRVRHQDLHAHGPSLVIGARQQALAQDAFQDQRQLGPDLGLLVRRKHVDDAVDGGGSRIGVQRGESQVAGLGDAERRFNGLQISHFADQNHIRVFSKGRPQGVGERLGVGVQLALVDHAVLVHVHELDRVLDGEDVLVALAVDLVDHGSQGGGLPRSGRSRHQDQAARLVTQLADHGRQSQLMEGLDLERNETEDARRGAALVEDVGAEAGQALQAEGEVEFETLFEAMLLGIAHHAVGQLFGLRRGELRQIERHQMPVHPDLRRRVGGDMEVAAGHFQHAPKQIA